MLPPSTTPVAVGVATVSVVVALPMAAETLPWYLTLALAAAHVAVLLAYLGERGALILIARDSPRSCPLRDPPENARLVHEDGRTIPLELVYRGHLDDIDHWGAVHPLGKLKLVGELWNLKADSMPSRCSIDLQV